jgi:hypothetical protein
LPFTNALATVPVSVIDVSPRHKLEVHWEPSTTDPILSLRESQGTTVWARILFPRLEDQQEPRGRITALSLGEAEMGNDGFKVMISCDWTGGGKEGGIIYLDKNLGFHHFALGW